MNKAILIGRLTAKPELKYTTSNIAVTSFNLAVDRPPREDGKKEADFIEIRVWRKQAENVANYLDKGSLVAIEGRIQTEKFTTKDGENRYKTLVIAERVMFLNSKKKEETKEELKNNDNDPFADFGQTVSIDDEFLD